MSISLDLFEGNLGLPFLLSFVGVSVMNHYAYRLFLLSLAEECCVLFVFGFLAAVVLYVMCLMMNDSFYFHKCEDFGSLT